MIAETQTQNLSCFCVVLNPKQRHSFKLFYGEKQICMKDIMKQKLDYIMFGKI